MKDKFETGLFAGLVIGIVAVIVFAVLLFHFHMIGKPVCEKHNATHEICIDQWSSEPYVKEISNAAQD